ncbi:MAG TPA: indole-3-glycerol phosphate synthase TrpC, partial [Thermoanaerobaculia bacterium]|nr:indole-3-glycerol phosphate synthase TrpC [Thermoanaerobaculia bacterium]
MNDVLAEIVERTRADLLAEPLDWRNLNRAARLRSGQKKKHSFWSAVRRGSTPGIIAEIKSASPSAGVIVSSPDVATIAREYRDGGAVGVSVVTEPQFFRGERSWLHIAGSASDLPVLMKDFIIDPVQVYRGVAAGADAVLLLASILETSKIRELIAILDELDRDAVVEVHDEPELEKAVEGGARIIGVNNRDLRDFSVSLETSERLAKRIPAGVVRVSESGIRSRADIIRL